MSNLSESILTYSGGSKEGLTEYMESAKKDFKISLMLIGALCVFFILALILDFVLVCLGLSKNVKPIDEDIVSTICMILFLFLGGLVVATYQYTQIKDECIKQIKKIEYEEQIKRE